MNIPSNLKYTLNDEWIKIDGNTGFIGITDHAQEQLSDIVYVEFLVSVGDEVKKGDSIVTVESVKAAAEVYSPVGGKILEINESLPDTPEKVNSNPYDDAWMIKIEIVDLSEVSSLLDAAAYEAKIAQDN